MTGTATGSGPAAPAPCPAGAGGFRHSALFYRGAEEYLDGILPFVRDGLARAEPVLVAVPEPNLAAVRDALGGAAERVRTLDMARSGRNPGRVIPGVLLAFADPHAAGPVRIVSETVWAGRSAAEYPACVQHEALVNTVLAGRPVTLLCPYDAVTLPARVLADACGTHPLLAGEAAADPAAGGAVPRPRGAEADGPAGAAGSGGTADGGTADGGTPRPVRGGADGPERAGTAFPEVPPEALAGARPSAGYAPGRLADACNRPLPEPAGALLAGGRLEFTAGTLHRPRAVAAAQAARLGLPAGRIVDLELAVNEVTTNSVVHGGGTGVLRMWAECGALVCEVRDAGRLDDPLAGRLPVPAGRPGGRGLLMANHLADLVRLHRAPDGLAVRLYFGLEPVHDGGDRGDRGDRRGRGVRTAVRTGC